MNGAGKQKGGVVVKGEEGRKGIRQRSGVYMLSMQSDGFFSLVSHLINLLFSCCFRVWVFGLCGMNLCLIKFNFSLSFSPFLSFYPFVFFFSFLHMPFPPFLLLIILLPECAAVR